MLYTRVISALIGAPLLLLLIFQGDWYLFIGALSVVLTGQFEFYELLAKRGFTGQRILGYLTAIGVMWCFYRHKLDLVPHFFCLLIVIMCFRQMLHWDKTYNNIDDLTGTLLGVLYPGLLFAYIFLVHRLGIVHLLLVFVISWANDTCAYFIGNNFGKRPFFPAVSPKKTLEGAIGGLAASTIVATLFSSWLGMHALQLAILGFFLGCTNQIGDLTESMLKRYAGVKDSGRLIPGHGGVLDRFDGILFTLPLAYLLFSLLG
jgi:phosphatidate cytidylyltransferase